MDVAEEVADAGGLPLLAEQFTEVSHLAFHSLLHCRTCC
jgi:hypothetical protein